MVHFRSPSWLTPAASHDGFSTDVHHHGSFTTAARGGLTPAPACRCRRTYLHLCNSMVAVDHSVFYIRTTQLPSGHTNALAETTIGLYKTECVRAGSPGFWPRSEFGDAVSRRLASFAGPFLRFRGLRVGGSPPGGAQSVSRYYLRPPREGHETVWPQHGGINQETITPRCPGVSL